MYRSQESLTRGADEARRSTRTAGGILATAALAWLATATTPALAQDSAADASAQAITIKGEAKDPEVAQAGAPPITVGSTQRARKLLAEFYARARRKEDRVAIGQQLITYEYGSKKSTSAWYGDWLQLQKQDLPLPEIMGGELSDLMTYPGFAPNQAALNALIKHGRSGHTVTLVWHPSVPVVGGNFGTPISTAELQNAVNDATTTGQNWQVQLDRAAAVLLKFAAAGVPVMFRPLHEQNGNFFWWGHDGSVGAALQARQAAWTALWSDMVTELTVRKGLKNLLFVFGTNQVNYAEVVPPLTYYPGAALVDMVSIDVYDEELDLAGSSRGIQYYQQLISTGKPFGLSEFGQSFGDAGTGPKANAWDARTLSKRIRDSYKRAVFAIAWYSSVEGGNSFVFALPDVAHTRELLEDPLIDTQEEAGRR